MKVSSAWVKYWLRRTMSDQLTDQQVASALERAGIEVESIQVSVEIDKRVVVALVKKVIQHPQADRLKICTVYDGTSEFSVVCGAHNVREGLKVAFCRPGSVLPGGEKIGEAKLRGVVSQGMLCSERELMLGRDHDGILELEDSAEVGLPVRELYPPDAVIDLTTPANRFDVQSVAGLAREVAAMTDTEMKPIELGSIESRGDGSEVKAAGEALRYMLARITVSPDGKTPREIAARLRALGMRSVSPVVDVTNYVMMELGQPLHAFDAAKVQLPVSVRRAEVGEKLTTLDGVQRKLSSADLVIADAAGPIALAGVMGGANTEIGADTTEILLESAVFDGVAVRKTAKRHGMRTEASGRFERGLAVELPPLGLARAVALLEQTVNGTLVAVTDQQNSHSKPRKIELTMDRLQRVLGFDVSHKEAVEALEKLQIGVVRTSKNKVEVPQVPWWRPDLNLPEDLAEEVVRVLGYDRVPSTLPPWRTDRLIFDRERAKRRRVRDVLYGCGLFEVATYSFVAEEQLKQVGDDPARHLKLKNPLSSEQAYLRSSLLPSHLAVLTRNRHYADEMGFYELSGVFLKKGGSGLPDEPVRLAVTMLCRDNVFARTKGVLDVLGRELNVDLRVEPANDKRFATGRCGHIKLGSKVLGWIGQLRPELVDALKLEGSIGYFEVDMEPVLASAGPRQFAGLAKFPVIRRDVTLTLATAVTWLAVQAVCEGQLVEFVSDYYGPELPGGQKAMTLRLTVQNSDRTPTEAEAAEAEAALVSRLERKLGAVRRV